MSDQDISTEKKEVETQTPMGAENIDELVNARVEEKLKTIKDNLDKAYAARDEALKKIAERERQDREAELKRLEEEGKLKEVAEMRLAEERAAREQAERRVVELTRDNTLQQVLARHDFRNARAQGIAFQELTGQLIQNAEGQWVHKSGESLDAAVERFVQDENNSFLLKPKISSGSGGSSPKEPLNQPVTSLFGMDQAAVLKLAREGKLPRRNNRK